VLSGIGSLGYGVFWLLAASLVPAMGGTHAAKEAVGLVAQVSGVSFFVAAVTVFAVFTFKMFVKRQTESPENL